MADDVELYAGIGIGRLSTPLSDDVRKMDGPCFHAARDAIGMIKDTGALRSKYRISKLNKVFLLTHALSDADFDFDTLELYYGLNNDYFEEAVRETATAKETNPDTSHGDLLLDGIILERTINLIIENNEIGLDCFCYFAISWADRLYQIIGYYKKAMS